MWNFNFWWWFKILIFFQDETLNLHTFKKLYLFNNDQKKHWCIEENFNIFLEQVTKKVIQKSICM